MGWKRLALRLQSIALGRLDADDYRRRGYDIGAGVHIGPGVRLDPSHHWLISIGDEATLGPNVNVLAHDGSLVMHLGVNYVAPVRIGERAFVGADSVVLPGVTIGQDAVVAAGSVVTKDVPPGSVVAGVPAREVGRTSELVDRHRQGMRTLPVYPVEGWTVEGGISAERRAEQRRAVAGGGYVAARRVAGRRPAGGAGPA